MKILAIHGVGRHRKGSVWERDWEDAISKSIRRVDPYAEFAVKYMNYDDIFSAHEIDAFDLLEATLALGHSGLIHWIGDRLSPRIYSKDRRPARQSTASVRWTASVIG